MISSETGAILATLTGVSNKESVLAFKGRLSDNPNVPEIYDLIYGGKNLDDKRLLKEYSITDKTYVFLKVPPPPFKIKGIVNINNSCYMNSVQQLFFSEELFRRMITEGKNDRLKKILSLYLDPKVKTVKNREALKLVRESLDIDDFEQQDANDQYNKFIETILGEHIGGSAKSINRTVAHQASEKWMKAITDELGVKKGRNSTAFMKAVNHPMTMGVIMLRASPNAGTPNGSPTESKRVAPQDQFALGQSSYFAYTREELIEKAKKQGISVDRSRDELLDAAVKKVVGDNEKRFRDAANDLRTEPRKIRRALLKLGVEPAEVKSMNLNQRVDRLWRLQAQQERNESRKTFSKSPTGALIETLKNLGVKNPRKKSKAELVVAFDALPNAAPLRLRVLEPPQYTLAKLHVSSPVQVDIADKAVLSVSQVYRILGKKLGLYKRKYLSQPSTERIKYLCEPTKARVFSLKVTIQISILLTLHPTDPDISINDLLERWMVDKCDEKSDTAADERTCDEVRGLCALPNLLVFGLRRIVSYTPRRKSRSRILGLRETIVLPNVLTDDSASYDLKAAVVHLGDTPNAGHYLTYIKHDDGSYWCANDGSATKISDADTFFENCGHGNLFLFKRR